MFHSAFSLTCAYVVAGASASKVARRPPEEPVAVQALVPPAAGLANTLPASRGEAGVNTEVGGSGGVGSALNTAEAGRPVLPGDQ